METGWAAPPPATGESLAHLHGNYAFPTPEGQMAERLLHGLGAPGPGQSTGPAGPGKGPGSSPAPGGSGLLGGLGGLAVTGALVLAGAALIVLGAFRASHAGEKIRQTGGEVAGAAQSAAGTAAVAA